jgi:hypothetical protein
MVPPNAKIRPRVLAQVGPPQNAFAASYWRLYTITRERAKKVWVELMFKPLSSD